MDDRPRSSGKRVDLDLFYKIMKEQMPAVAVELGTGQCGLTPHLAEIMEELGGDVWTFDIFPARFFPPNSPELPTTLAKLESMPHVKFFKEDIQALNSRVIEAALMPNAFIFCDNGNKPLELANYAPYISKGGVIGTHDYLTEVKPEWAVPFFERAGFTQIYKEECELNDSVAEYGLSRFWRRN